MKEGSYQRSEIKRVLSQENDFLQQEFGIPEFLGFDDTERSRYKPLRMDFNDDFDFLVGISTKI